MYEWSESSTLFSFKYILVCVKYPLHIDITNVQGILCYKCTFTSIKNNYKKLKG